jgi:hypothetical protein
MPAKNSLLNEISFPVNLCRELLEKWLQHSVFLATKVASLALKMQIPAQFPVSREFAGRRVRSALRRQGGSLGRTSIFPIYN